MGCCASTGSVAVKKRKENTPLTDEEKARRIFTQWFRDYQCSVTQSFELSSPPTEPQSGGSSDPTGDGGVLPVESPAVTSTVESCLQAEAQALSKALYGQIVSDVGIVCVARKLPKSMVQQKQAGNPLDRLGSEKKDERDEWMEGNSPRPVADGRPSPTSTPQTPPSGMQLLKHRSVQHHHDVLRETRDTLVCGSIFASQHVKEGGGDCEGSGEGGEPLKGIDSEELVKSMTSSAIVAAQGSHHSGKTGGSPSTTIRVVLPPWNFLSFEGSGSSRTGSSSSHQEEDSLDDDDEEEESLRCQLSLLKLTASRHDGECLLTTSPKAWTDEEDRFEVIAEYLVVESHTAPGVVVGGLGLVPSARWASRLAPSVTRISGTVLK